MWQITSCAAAASIQGGSLEVTSLIFAKEQVLQRKPISETFSKMPKIFSRGAANKQREGKKPSTKLTWLDNKQAKPVPEVVVRWVL